MGYLELVNRYTSLSMLIGYLEDQQRRGDDDLKIVRELEYLRDEQRRVGEQIDEYNARYNA